MQSLPTIDEIDAELAARSLEEFSQQAWPVVEPGTPLVWSWHLSAICEHLEAVTRGDIRNLVINVPPGHMKSLLTCVFWPAWEWLRNPGSRWLFASYAASLSIRDSVKCRRVIESPWYRGRWGDRFKLTGDQNAKVKFENDLTGYRIATSVGGSATGERASRVVVDDPHNVKDRESDTRRESVIDWWDNVYSNRLADYQRDARVIIQQRVHERDLAGHVIARGGYEHLCLPTEYEPGRRTATCIGWEDPRTAEGELLFPQRFGPTEVAEAKLTLGSAGYAGQHQQRPTPAGGGLFKEKWFRYWRREGDLYLLIQKDGTWHSVPVADCRRFAVLDVAGTEARHGTDPDYSVMQAWDVTPTNELLLVDQWRDRVELPDVAATAVRKVREWDCPVLLCEQNGIGLGVFQSIQRAGVAVQGIKSVRDKVSRSQTAQIRMEAGAVYFPQGAAFLPELEAELTTFPFGAHDDQVDDVSLAAIHVHTGLDFSFFDGGEVFVGD